MSIKRKKSLLIPVIGFVLATVTFTGCESIFGTKGDSTTDEIIETGRIDPTLEDVDGYAPVLPFWEGFDQPTDVFVGFDEFVYVTDAEGVHLLDRADLGDRRTIELDGAVAVAQDRLLNVYVAARINVPIPERDGDIFNLPAVFKIKNLNGSGELTMVDTLIFPFDDLSLSTRAAQISRLNKNRDDNYENVTITGISALADNSIYISRTGPKNDNSGVAAPDNIILEFDNIVENGEETPKMTNVRQLRSLSPVNPSLASSVGVSDVNTLIGPPQRNSFVDEDNRSFLIAQADPNAEIPFRVLWINAVETTDGLVFEPNRDLLRQDTAAADSFLYEPFRFQNPQGIAFAGDQTRFIFVVDADQHRLYQFQANGREGVTPPPGAADRSKLSIVSFGGLGDGPKEFNSPSGVAYFERVVYVADKNNNRIARYKLTSDFE